ncbi:MAG: carboxypeptidase regulatory-like domain-containing protein [Actinobacteria bacterium]|nr:carboxypeptidase regulatory-like domain-containing protein [Actinomycetota bacterium]
MLVALLAATLTVVGCGQVTQADSPSSTLALGSLGTVAPTTTLSGSAALRVRVTDAARTTVTGVQVDVSDESGQVITQTSAATAYRVAGLEPGRYDVHVDARGTKYMSQSHVVEVRAGENETDFVLEVGRTIAGRVTWSGRPYVWVGASPSRADDGETRQVEVSAGSGNFVIEGLTPGHYVVNADVFWYGGESYETATVIDLSAGDAKGLDFDLGRLEPLPTTTIDTRTTASHT